VDETQICKGRRLTNTQDPPPPRKKKKTGSVAAVISSAPEANFEAERKLGS